MKGMKDILVLGGVMAAGYLLLQSGDSGGGSIQYIRNIPRSFSPEVKEAPPAPTIIQFPSETVNFPTPKLASLTSLLPPMPTTKTEPVKKTQPVTSTPKKEKKYTEPSPESWEAFTTEVWGSKPGEVNKKWGVGTVASFEDVKRFGYPKSYLDWLKNPYSVPDGKKEPTMEDIPQAWNPQATFYEQVGGLSGGSSSKKSTKKTTSISTSKKTTTTTTKKKELNVPSMWNPQATFYEQIGGITGGNSSIIKTSSKKTVEKKPPALPGVTWVKKGTGWIPA